MEKKSVYIDELTCLYNRQYLEEKQMQKVRALVAHGTPFSIAIVNIDHFAAINDAHGHAKGDEVLREFAQFLLRELRKSDTIIRYSGDEFVCIMSKTMHQDAEWIYRRIARACRNRQFSGLPLTLSAGIAAFPEDGKTLPNLLKVARGALDIARQRGRDQIQVVEKKAIQLPIKILVDRTNEKRTLETAVSSDAEQVTIARVQGCVGIGKTRLVKDVLDNLTRREIIWADCSLMAGGISYHPIREAIEYRMMRRGVELFKAVPRVYRYEVAKIVPEIGETITEEIGEKERIVDKYRLYEGIKRFFQAGDFPRTVVIDNFQWIDKASLDVVEYLVRSLARTSFVFIQRDDEVSDAVDAFMERMAAEDRFIDIALTVFERSDVSTCLEAILGEEPSETLTEYVTEESAGIPYYIEEIMRDLHYNRYLVIEDGVWRFKQPHQHVLPQCLEEIALRKYRRVSKKSQDVLNIASVIGWFDREIIQEMTALDESELADLLKTMVGVGLVKYRGDNFEFSEEASRNAIYKECVEATKGVTLHRQIAERLEQRAGDEQRAARRLAYHYYHAHDTRRGVLYCKRAADRAKQRYDYDEVVQDHTWALELLGDDQDEKALSMKIGCLRERAYALHTIGDCEAALDDLTEGLKYARHLGDTESQATILAQRALVYHDTSRHKEAIAEAGKSRKLFEQIDNVRGIAGTLTTVAFSHLAQTQTDKAIEMFTQVLQLYADIEDKSEQSKMLNQLGTVYFARGDCERALDYYEKALNKAHEAEDTVAMGVASDSIGTVYRNLGDYQRALASCERALAIMEEIGHRRQEAVTRANIAIVYDELGEYQTSLEYHHAALKIAIETGDKRGEAVYQSNVSAIYSKLGQNHTSLNLFEKSLALARQNRFRVLEVHILSHIGYVHYLMGNYSEGFEISRQAEERAQNMYAEREVFHNALVLALLHMAVDEMDRAKQYMESAYKIASRLCSRRMRFSIQTLLCDYYLTVRDYDNYKQTMQQLRQTTKTPVTTPEEATLNLLSGRYNLQTGKASKARTLLGRSLKVFKELGEQQKTGEVHYYRALLEHKKGDSQKAKKSIKRALEIFNAIGAHAWSDKVGKALNDMQ